MEGLGGWEHNIELRAAVLQETLLGFLLREKVKRSFIRGAWLLAEARIRGIEDSKNPQRISRLEEKLKESPLGEKLLSESREIEGLLRESPAMTRKMLAGVVNRKIRI